MFKLALLDIYGGLKKFSSGIIWPGKRLLFVIVAVCLDHFG